MWLTRLEHDDDDDPSAEERFYSLKVRNLSFQLTIVVSFGLFS